MVASTPNAPSAPALAAAAATAALLLRRRIERGPSWLPVVGASMGRTIRTGSEVLVARSAEPRFGEVWAFCNTDGVLVVHRFARRRHQDYYFQGDAHWPDPPVSRDLLVGRVLRVRYQGRERGLGAVDRLTGGARLMFRQRGRALAIRLGLRRVRDLGQALLGRRRSP